MAGGGDGEVQPVSKKGADHGDIKSSGFIKPVLIADPLTNLNPNPFYTV